VPLPYPAKSKIGTIHQVELYQAMDTSACLENLKQLTKILWRWILGKHDRKHGCQGFLKAIDGFLDMLNTIL
jgi:hypothetical protein